jgi:hypothetical protein
MEINLGREIIGPLWSKLNEPFHPTGVGNIDYLGPVLQKGWGNAADISDLIWEGDIRAYQLFHRTEKFHFLRTHFDLHFVHVFEGPCKKVDEVWGEPAMRASDIAQLLMEIERLGFSVSPERLTNALKSALSNQSFLTNSEVSVGWYEKQRHR